MDSSSSSSNALIFSMGPSSSAPKLLQRTLAPNQGSYSLNQTSSQLPEKRRIGRAAAFASLSVGAVGGGDALRHRTAPMPLFMVASASEKRHGNPNAPAWKVAVGNLMAGATAGCAVEAALYPIDTIKTRLQAMIGGGGIKALIEAGGGKALYAGVWGNLCGTAPSSAIFMAFYEPVKHAVQARVPDEQHYLGPIAAGVVAGLASSITRVPTEVVKSRLQTGELKGAMAAVKSIFAREGLRGFYQGYGAFLLRDLPFDAIEFFSYEQLKRVYGKSVGRDLHVAETSIIGAMAGGFTGIITTPLDVLKTRLMTQGASGRYSSLWNAATTIARTEGMSAFMLGWQPRLIWISLGGFVFFPVLEAAKEFYAPK